MMTKMLLREAAVKFVDKPKLCFRFLQEHGILFHFKLTLNFD